MKQLLILCACTCQLYEEPNYSLSFEMSVTSGFLLCIFPCVMTLSLRGRRALWSTSSGSPWGICRGKSLQDPICCWNIAGFCFCTLLMDSWLEQFCHCSYSLNCWQWLLLKVFRDIISRALQWIGYSSLLSLKRTLNQIKISAQHS